MMPAIIVMIKMPIIIVVIKIPIITAITIGGIGRRYQE